MLLPIPILKLTNFLSWKINVAITWCLWLSCHLCYKLILNFVLLMLLLVIILICLSSLSSSCLFVFMGLHLSQFLFLHTCSYLFICKACIFIFHLKPLRNFNRLPFLFFLVGFFNHLDLPLYGLRISVSAQFKQLVKVFVVFVFWLLLLYVNSSSIGVEMRKLFDILLR